MAHKPRPHGLFRSLFKDSVNYRKVIEVLSKKLVGLTREDISNESGVSGGELSRILSNLYSCDFIRSYVAVKKKERNQLYQLTDMFSLFYLRFGNRLQDLKNIFGST